MVNVKNLEMWNMSLSMLLGKSPKIKYACGECGMYNETRIFLNSVRLGCPYVKCSLCGEINNTGLKLD